LIGISIHSNKGKQQLAQQNARGRIVGSVVQGKKRPVSLAWARMRFGHLGDDAAIKSAAAREGFLIQ